MLFYIYRKESFLIPFFLLGFFLDPWCKNNASVFHTHTCIFTKYMWSFFI